jgi:putative drug exporter of the RND superfamily
MNANRDFETPQASEAATILFDAFVVRMTVIPAVHRLLGDRGWWLPRGLGRALPNLDIRRREAQ